MGKGTGHTSIDRHLSIHLHAQLAHHVFYNRYFVHVVVVSRYVGSLHLALTVVHIKHNIKHNIKQMHA